MKVEYRKTTGYHSFKNSLDPEWMSAARAHTNMGNLYAFHPKDWNNIPHPLVDVVTCLLQEVYKLHQKTDHTQIRFDEHNSSLRESTTKMKRETEELRQRMN